MMLPSSRARIVPLFEPTLGDSLWNRNAIIYAAPTPEPSLSSLDS
jgi:hypothetical protein